jgi:hypothetical protein
MLLIAPDDVRRVLRVAPSRDDAPIVTGSVHADALPGDAK